MSLKEFKKKVNQDNSLKNELKSLVAAKSSGRMIMLLSNYGITIEELNAELTDNDFNNLSGCRIAWEVFDWLN